MVNSKRKFHVERRISKVLLLIIFLPFMGRSQHFTTTVMQLKSLPEFPTTDVGIKNYLQGFKEYKALPKGYADWFYWTNYSRQNPVAFWDSVVVPVLAIYPNLNSSYAQSLKKELYNTMGLALLRPNTSLLKVSQAHASDLARNTPGRISHNSTNGDAFEKRVFSAGIQKCAAENLSLGPFNPVLALVLLYIDEGLPGVGHRKNLLNPYYVEMGIGIAGTKGNTTVVVQDFACDQPR